LSSFCPKSSPFSFYRLLINKSDCLRQSSIGADFALPWLGTLDAMDDNERNNDEDKE
jgi:hypothetical protein